MAQEHFPVQDDEPDDRLKAFEKRQQLFISQRLENHSKTTQNYIGEVERRLRTDINKVLDASATAHKEIIERLERLENPPDTG